MKPLLAQTFLNEIDSNKIKSTQEDLQQYANSNETVTDFFGVGDTYCMGFSDNSIAIFSNSDGVVVGDYALMVLATALYSEIGDDDKQAAMGIMHRMANKLQKRREAKS